jgi:CYTH domain-containing protein
MVDACAICLPEAEFAVLESGLTGQRLTKTRHRLHARPGVLRSVDEFHGALAGLILAEAEFKSDEALTAFAMPLFAVREVTKDPSSLAVGSRTMAPPSRQPR